MLCKEQEGVQGHTVLARRQFDTSQQAHRQYSLVSVSPNSINGFVS